MLSWLQSLPRSAAAHSSESHTKLTCIAANLPIWPPAAAHVLPSAHHADKCTLGHGRLRSRAHKTGTSSGLSGTSQLTYSPAPICTSANA